MNKNWYIFVDDYHQGPFTANELLQSLDSGDLSNDSFIWKQGLGDWVELKEARPLLDGENHLAKKEQNDIFKDLPKTTGMVEFAFGKKWSDELVYEKSSYLEKKTTSFFSPQAQLQREQNSAMQAVAIDPDVGKYEASKGRPDDVPITPDGGKKSFEGPHNNLGQQQIDRLQDLFQNKKSESCAPKAGQIVVEKLEDLDPPPVSALPPLPDAQMAKIEEPPPLPPLPEADLNNKAEVFEVISTPPAQSEEYVELSEIEERGPLGHDKAPNIETLGQVSIEKSGGLDRQRDLPTKEVRSPLPEVKLFNFRDQLKRRVKSLKKKNSERPLGDRALSFVCRPGIIIPLLVVFIFSIVAGAYVYLSFQFPNRPAGMSPKDYATLKATQLQDPSEKLLVKYAVDRKGKRIWMASNFSGEVLMNIKVKSIQGKVLTNEKIEFSSEGIYKNNMAVFKNFDFKEGPAQKAGYYSISISSVRPLRAISLFDKIRHLLKGKTPEFKKLNENQIIFWGTESIQKNTYSNHLKKFKSFNQKQDRGHFEDLKEKYRTLIEFLGQVDWLYFSVLEGISKGNQISEFKQKYQLQLGVLLGDIVIGNNKLTTELKGQRPKLAQMYKDVDGLNRKIGGLVGEMVAKTNAVKTLSSGQKKRLKRHFKKKIKSLEDDLKTHQNKVIEYGRQRKMQGT